jgi:hypothetical protein
MAGADPTAKGGKKKEKSKKKQGTSCQHPNIFSLRFRCIGYN